MEADAQTQVLRAAARVQNAGINVSTIYYSGTDTDPTDQAAYKTFLASLVTGTGSALVAPTTALAIDASYASLCSSIPSVLPKFAN